MSAFVTLRAETCLLNGPDALVTGGAGFIGSHLVERVVARGRRVRVLEKTGAALDHLHVARIEVLLDDVRDASAVAKAVQGCTTVYHLAAIPHLWVHPRGLFHQVNFVGARHVLDAALAAGAKQILHVSTESILTRANQTTSITEDQVVTPAD